MTQKNNDPNPRLNSEGADAELIALSTIYARHQGELLSFVRGKVGNGPPDPDDIVQQAFANYAARDDRTSIRSPIAFLIRTAGNLIHDHFRRSATRLNVSANGSEFDELLSAHDELSPEVVVLGRQRFSIVMAAMRALPRRQRRFLLRNRIEGLSYTAIAKANGVSVSTVLREVEAAVEACQTALIKMTNEDDE